MSKRPRIVLVATAVVTFGLSAYIIGIDSTDVSSLTLSDLFNGGPGNVSSDGKVVPNEMSHEVARVVKSAQKELDGLAGAALVTPDEDSEVVSTGDLKTGPAWSTSKTPIAVTYVHQSGMDTQVESAITVSDNDTAESMWCSLGDDMAVGATTDEILREDYDTRTVMGIDRIHAEYTVLGQTR